MGKSVPLKKAQQIVKMLVSSNYKSPVRQGNVDNKIVEIFVGKRQEIPCFENGRWMEAGRGGTSL